MRVVCKVLDAPTCAVGGHRAGKGAIALGTMNTPGLRTSKACLSVFTATGKESKYPLDGSSELKNIHDKFIKQGKVTIVWERPARTIMVSDAKPEVLANLVHKLRGVLNGENIDTLKEITKEKKSDLGGQVELIVRNRQAYPSKTFPTATLKNLVLSGIGLQRVDGRWFSCTLLTSLDLSKNRMSSAPDLVKMKLIGRLINLQILNLSNNRLEKLPEEMVASFPPSLLSLDLSFNLFRSIPTLSTVPLLNLLNMANNRLVVLPKELRNRESLCLNLDNNHIKFLPYMVSNRRRTFSISGNPLDEPVRTPDLTKVRCPTMLQWAMQSIRRNRIRLDDIYTVRFWEEEGIDFCDYCKTSFAADRLFPFIKSMEASTMSQQAAFNTSYPIRVVACRECYQSRNNPRRNPPVPRRIAVPVRRIAVPVRRN